jgi:hypothetical protein
MTPFIMTSCIINCCANHDITRGHVVIGTRNQHTGSWNPRNWVDESHILLVASLLHGLAANVDDDNDEYDDF